MSFVQVSETNDGEREIFDLPLEEDGTLLLSTLRAQYPDASGLKYIAPDNGRTRALRIANAKIHPPSAEGWGDVVYFCSVNKDKGQKRKLNEEFKNYGERAPKEQKSEATSTIWIRDLFVLGLAWKTTDEDLKSYFSKYGELRRAQVKKTPNGLSRGFGIIRFKEQKSQLRSMLDSHVINGRRCEIKIARVKDAFMNEAPKKIFVGQLTESITQEDLIDYFKKFGDITDVFFPYPFKGFAFVSFTKSDSALTAVDQDHFIKNVRLNVLIAFPKDDKFRGSRSSDSSSNYNGLMRGSRDQYSSQGRYYDDGGRDGYNCGSYSDRYRDNRYDSKPYSNNQPCSVWLNVDSSSPPQNNSVSSQMDPNLVAAVVEKTVSSQIDHNLVAAAVEKTVSSQIDPNIVAAALQKTIGGVNGIEGVCAKTRQLHYYQKCFLPEKMFSWESYLHLVEKNRKIKLLITKILQKSFFPTNK